MKPFENSDVCWTQEELHIKRIDCFHTRTFGKSEGIERTVFLTMATIVEGTYDC